MHMFERFHRRLQEKNDNYGAKAVTYVAIGDSVTQGAVEDGIIEHEQVYHQLLRSRIFKRYPSTIVNVINSGVIGDTAVASKSRWQRDVLSYQPDLVTIKFGLNDAHSGEAGIAPYIEAIEELVGRIREETESDILLLTPSMMMKRDNPGIAPNHRMLVPDFIRLYQQGNLSRYVEAVRSFAARNSLPLLDVYAMWEDMEARGIDIHERLGNGINHPDRLFHHELADRLEQMLF